MGEAGKTDSSPKVGGKTSNVKIRKLRLDRPFFRMKFPGVKKVHPGKINGWTINDGGLVQIIFLSFSWVICRFQPLIFQGVVIPF